MAQIADTMTTAYVRSKPADSGPPPLMSRGAIAWLRQNLFSSWQSAVLTLAALYIVWLIVPPAIEFLFTHAVWSGKDREACLSKEGREVGACWPFIWARLGYFTYGQYPFELRWRVDLVFLLEAIGVIWLLAPRIPYKGLGALFFFVVFPLLAYGLLTGLNPFSFHSIPPLWLVGIIALAVVAGLLFMASRSQAPGRFTPTLTVLAVIVAVGLLEWGWDALHMPYVSTNLWGGVMVTMVISTIGIVVSLPFGTVLALGRRSKLPFVRFVCVLFIEIVRGVPLITMLFMANRMLPLFLSEGMQPDSLMRVIVGVALFASAYMAEVVRGGLQAMPRGQYEGAMSLGLNYPKMIVFIILPQALKLVIPGIVNSFIALFKDTTLVTIVGIFDFLTTIQVSINSPDWAAPTTAFTGYVFAAIFYFICCFGMSRYSLAMERRLAAGQHR
jgi:general L-amino acid transport system permease protein